MRLWLRCPIFSMASEVVGACAFPFAISTSLSAGVCEALLVSTGIRGTVGWDWPITLVARTLEARMLGARRGWVEGQQYSRLQ